MVLLSFAIWLVQKTRATLATNQMRTQINLNLVTRDFPRFEEFACGSSELSSAPCDVFFCCNWPVVITKVLNCIYKMLLTDFCHHLSHFQPCSIQQTIWCICKLGPLRQAFGLIARPSKCFIRRPKRRILKQVKERHLGEYQSSYAHIRQQAARSARGDL